MRDKKTHAKMSGNRVGRWYQAVNGAAREYPTSRSVVTGLRRPGPDFDPTTGSVEGRRGTYYDGDHWLANYLYDDYNPRKKASRKQTRTLKRK